MTTLVSGFGLYKTIEDGFAPGYLLLAIPVAFAAASVGIGTWAMRPRTKDVSSIGNLAELQGFVEGVLSERARWMTRATTLFALSLLFAPLTLLPAASQNETSDATINASWSRAEKGKQAVKVEVEVDRLPERGLVEALVTARRAKGGERLVLLRSVESAGSPRKGKISATFRPLRVTACYMSSRRSSTTMARSETSNASGSNQVAEPGARRFRARSQIARRY